VKGIASRIKDYVPATSPLAQVFDEYSQSDPGPIHDMEFTDDKRKKDSMRSWHTRGAMLI
jgi:hypothetical protein